MRLFLNGFELTPTFKDVNKKFSVRYYLNLVLIDQVRGANGIRVNARCTSLRFSADMGRPRARALDLLAIAGGPSVLQAAGDHALAPGQRTCGRAAGRRWTADRGRSQLEINAAPGAVGKVRRHRTAT